MWYIIKSLPRVEIQFSCNLNNLHQTLCTPLISLPGLIGSPRLHTEAIAGELVSDHFVSSNFRRFSTLCLLYFIQRGLTYSQVINVWQIVPFALFYPACIAVMVLNLGRFATGYFATKWKLEVVTTIYVLPCNWDFIVWHNFFLFCKQEQLAQSWLSRMLQSQNSKSVSTKEITFYRKLLVRKMGYAFIAPAQVKLKY